MEYGMGIRNSDINGSISTRWDHKALFIQLPMKDKQIKSRICTIIRKA